MTERQPSGTQRQRRRVAARALAAASSLAVCACCGQQIETRANDRVATYGNRPIDSLPKSNYAQSEDIREWNEPGPPVDFEVSLHLKGLFRVGRRGIERLCVVEARRPEHAPTEGASLLLRRPDGRVLWRGNADWLGTNQRMRPYWLPVDARTPCRLMLTVGRRTRVDVEAQIGLDAPHGLISTIPSRQPLAVDAGFALLADSAVLVQQGAPVAVDVGLALPTGLRGSIRATARTVGDGGGGRLLGSTTVPVREGRGRARLKVNTDRVHDPRTQVEVVVVAGDATIASRRLEVHLVKPPPPPAFGADYTDLKYPGPVRDGDVERSWDSIWGGQDLRDVVVSFPGEPYRMVFWRGANYVPCWTLPEAWLTYEWLEAEPDFYGAVGCVEPLQDKDCRYSRVAVTSSTAARAVVTWDYALTDLNVKIIRDERAREVFTFYPDGTGTRVLTGHYRDGWHENQEFIVVNRPGRWPSQALSAQAVTFLSPAGDREWPFWPKPGFSVDGWSQVISIVNLGSGPRPFMVTPSAPSTVKVWADPFVDKPDIFNSYPHWPVTRGMRTAWLDDPAQFALPTHSNLVNLVNAPVRETPDEKEFIWLIGMGHPNDAVLAAARCWLEPGTLVDCAGVRSTSYSQSERAYRAEMRDGEKEARFTLAPAAGVPVVNPAFLVGGWQRRAAVTVDGAEEVRTGVEDGRLVVWVRGTFAGKSRVRIAVRE